MIDKNGVYRVTITDLTDEGSGIGKIGESGGYTVFTDGVIPGDVAEIKIIKSNKKSFIIRAVTRAPIITFPTGRAEVLFPIPEV